MHELFQEVSKSKNEYKKKIDQGNKDLYEKYIITENNVTNFQKSNR
jgi:hypothetical protein